MKTAFTAKIIFESDRYVHWTHNSGSVVTIEKMLKAILSGEAKVVEIVDDGLTNNVNPIIVFKDTK